MYICIGLAGLFGIYIRGTGSLNVEKYLKKLEKKHGCINRENAKRYDYYGGVLSHITVILQGILIRGWIFWLVSIIVLVIIGLVGDMYIKRKFIIK